MNLLGPTRYPRLNEAAAVVFLMLSVCFTLSLASYHPQDPSWNTATGALRPQNLIGFAGSYLADLCFQIFGLAAFALPALVLALAWRWVRSKAIEAPIIKVIGASMMLAGVCSLLSLGPWARAFNGAIPSGGILGMLVADSLTGALNTTGAVLATGIELIISLYLVSTFTMRTAARWFAAPIGYLSEQVERLQEWISGLYQRHVVKAREKREKAEAKQRLREEEQEEKRQARASRAARRRGEVEEQPPAPAAAAYATAVEDPPIVETEYDPYYASPAPAYEPEPEPSQPEDDDIPIRVLEDPAPVSSRTIDVAPWDDPLTAAVSEAPARPRRQTSFQLPPAYLLTEPPARNPYDSQELKDTAAAIKSKFEEFNVLGNVTQINPGPVVTTFEFKPEAGIKLSRITTLSEDLCLGLQAESVMIERIPGKPTVGIEVPNTKSEIISLRQILESEEFQNASSYLTIALGKDINGRIKVAAMETMPHLLIAGSTGSGKSVMLNSMIMSILYKSTPNEVRMIMVDPKRVELGMYEGIPHLLTPVITDPKKATNALRNAVLEMERRLKLLASRGVRNIDQFNKKIRQMAEEAGIDPATTADEDFQLLPYILIIIDELADLMMLERAGVEECVTRLAQMARAVGMHVVLATQRPSVDVITGLIKANFPARISFRVATRVDSRTILDCMGAEHLLGKGDMLFLPPGSSRLVRVHGAYVSETETMRVVEFWKQQAEPQYDASYLAAPPSEDGDDGDEAAEFDGTEDPKYQEAVRTVMQVGKASTSILQRRLRLGYGRAARILDMMERDGIIGPPDGSRPREVLKRPDWLDETEEQFR